MNFTKISELEKPYLIVNVTDQMAKKRYFEDSEINGWILVEEENKIDIFHTYRQADNKELSYLPDAQLISKKDKKTVLDEAKIQDSSEEDLEILGYVQKAFNTNKIV